MNNAPRVGDCGLRPRCARRLLQPHSRVWWALWRRSRDRWLSPDDLLRLGVAYAACISSNPHKLLLSAIQGDVEKQWCSEVGMLRGYPPFNPNEHGYKAFRIYMRNMNHHKCMTPEQKILNLKLKEIRLGS